MVATIPVSVEQEQAKSMSIKEQEEHQLVTSNKLELFWRVVCGTYEHQELSHYNIIKPWPYANERHKLLDDIKMPNHTKWQGPWGPEPLWIDKEDDIVRGPLGVVWATEARGQEIAKWLRDEMFNVAPGND
jgi:muconolactone delta-isomerase